MIPTVEDILEDLAAGKITKEQAMAWMAQHFVMAEQEACERAEATQIPEGWKLVPKNPTEEMIQGARSAIVDEGYICNTDGYYAIYYRMTGAAPQPPSCGTSPQEGK